MASLTTSVEPLEGNKVRLSVTVPSAEFEKAIDAAFRKLAGEVKIPGFRPGKAPRASARGALRHRRRPRAGAARLAARLLRGRPSWPSRSTSSPRPRSTSPPARTSGDVAFDAVVEVRPVVTLDGYDGLRGRGPEPRGARRSRRRAGRRAPRALRRSRGLRATPLIDGNFASIDIKGSVDDEVIDALSATDFLYEVGSAMLVDELDAELRGTEPGAILKFDADAPRALRRPRRRGPSRSRCW